MERVAGSAFCENGILARQHGVAPGIPTASTEGEAVGERPTGTVTFLFTDIEGSTRLWEERPDAMRAAVAEHDDLLRGVIEANGGFVFATGGDGFAAAFGRAADAVAAAEQTQAAVAGIDQIAVRMGINTGEVHERDGDYFGPAVNRTARLMAAGHGGQVLVSGVTAELVPGLVLRNLGEHRLRDLGSPMPIWQLGTVEFPQLRSLDELPGNLPVQRTSFVGRADEVKALATLVGSQRLVTLTGPGGVGKSRLALQVGAEVAPEFRDGVWFVGLTALEEGALVAATVVNALGILERRGESPLETLCAWGRARHALVVLDNCEHLLTEVAEVVDRMAEACSTLSVVATSQSSLGVRGEHLWTVAPLSGPGGSPVDSVELFADRARMVRSDFRLTSDNEDAVVEICERLDHIPLAIELAAARVQGMAPADVVRRLDQRLRLLASSDRSAPGRHRTLDAAVRWSYELLDENQRRVFDRCSVFAAPFTIEAAEVTVVGDGVDEWEVLEGILALVVKSLVVADETSDATRYHLLETMRQFGQANLSATGTEAFYRDRHADYYADYVLSRRGQLQGSGDQLALDQVEGELENIRVALRRAADDTSTSRFEELYGALYLTWVARGRASEGMSWATALTGRAILEPARRIRTLGFAAAVANNHSLDLGQELAQAAGDLAATTHAAPPLVALSVMNLGTLMQGRTEEAIAGCDRVIALAPDEPDRFIRSVALGQCLAVLTTCGALDRLEYLQSDVGALAEDLDNQYLRTTVWSEMAPIIHLTDPDHAGEFLRKAYRENKAIGNFANLSMIAMFLALHELRSGDDGAAARWANRALQAASDHGLSYVAATINATVAISKRHSITDATILLSALRSHRSRKQQAGTQIEIDAECRYEASLRRKLGTEFDALYAKGMALDEAAMITSAFNQLDAIVECTDEPTETHVHPEVPR
jgi:predicted ATPase/class 3 adenylate cyclase